MTFRKRRKKQFVSKFVGLEHIVMDTPAFQDTSGDAVKLLLLTCRRHNGENNGKIPFSVREAAGALNVSLNTAAKKFQELVDHGFLVIETRGAFSVKNKQATLWRVTLYPSAGGKPATRDYARWTPNMKNTVSNFACDGIKNCDRDPISEGKKPLTVANINTVKASKPEPTVSKTETLIESSHRAVVAGGTR